MAKSIVKLKSSRQSDSFTLMPGESMRYVLLLNGVIPGIHPQFDSRMEAEDWLRGELEKSAPHALPSVTGPISLVLVL
jgi:hypothetical protein